MLVDKIRISLGSAAVLNMIPQKFEISPSTCYLMTYTPGKCSANCGFCPQSRSSSSTSDKLSRITWPEFSFSNFLIKLQNLESSERFKRICIQTLNYPNNFDDLVFIVQKIQEKIDIEISVAIPPLSIKKLKKLKTIGVKRIGIALDAATPEIFRKIKGDLNNGFYSWNKHFKGLLDASMIFPNNVSTHIIVGLGETQKEILTLLLKLKELEIKPSLFAFTPVKGTFLENQEKPSILDYRLIQLSRYLIIIENKGLNDFLFSPEGKIQNIKIDKKHLKKIIKSSKTFKTVGCPNCDRPFYTSRPGGPFYNFPRDLNDIEKKEIYRNLKNYVNK